MRIALIGDYSEDVIAHRAINASLTLAAEQTGQGISYDWLPTDSLTDPTVLAGYSGAWVVPASPYASFDNVITALHYIRTHQIPFLGTCGGYQHALVEFARNKLGYRQAGITEIEPDCPMPLISSLVCSLIEETDPVLPEKGGLIDRTCGPDPLTETYHCSFGINPDHADIFEHTDFKIAARAPDGAIRAMALDGHPFFLGTAFQPERAGLEGRVHPIVSAFIDAAATRK